VLLANEKDVITSTKIYFIRLSTKNYQSSDGTAM